MLYLPGSTFLVEVWIVRDIANMVLSLVGIWITKLELYAGWSLVVSIRYEFQLKKMSRSRDEPHNELYNKYEYEIRYHPGKTNVVIDALRRKERVKPRRVRAMAMTIQYGVRGMILASQSETFKKENVLAERLHGLD
ncbi:hypothetical protein Tco_0954886 [Tanacetum coccineum]|uniref:Reverse transcriptase domain-containing protein n=1 Tax=Tanacetum coccineum TaxID=301880 RepID=A0ABQ5E5N0_9ASTR